ncbi:hypothetical protein ACFV19_21480 [Streptomyces griseoluteus]|uniref:hypothetical protein n=1 Tax=Streptomyces griseoluteus TaxID=29306 RepID=UPI00368C2D90
MHRLRDLGLAHLHVVRADPGDEVYRRLRADWPGTLIGNPVLTGLTTEAVARASREMLASGADLVALGRPLHRQHGPRGPALRRGAPLRERYLMYVGGADGCADYPALADR